MYTVSPVPDYSDAHFGFYFIVLVLFIINILVILIASTEEKVVPIIGLVMSMVVGYVAFNDSYTPKHPLNKVVEAKLVGFQAEGYVTLSGKNNNTRTDHHNTYVVYETPEGQAILKASQGVAYPSRAILYKN